MKACLALKGLFLGALCSLCVACVTTGSCCVATTDNEITTNVQTRLAGDRGFTYLNIDVTTFERIVTLKGTLENYTQACIAVKYAREVPCVRHVRARFRIRPPQN